MQNIKLILLLAGTALLLNGCCVAPYHYRNYRPYAKKGYQCPPPMKMDNKKKAVYRPEYKPECEPEYRPVCEPECRPACVYSP
jgi:hypothetical protein